MSVAVIISPRPYRHQCERFTIGPMQGRLRATLARRERIQKLQKAISNFVKVNYQRLNGIRN